MCIADRLRMHVVELTFLCFTVLRSAGEAGAVPAGAGLLLPSFCEAMTLTAALLCLVLLGAGKAGAVTAGNGSVAAALHSKICSAASVNSLGCA
jgi:hypothetical protein